MNTCVPVTFNYATWVAMFPQLSAVTEAQADGYFMRATNICANSTTNPIFPNGNLAALLYLLTAHMAWISRSAGGGLVGRISNATEGSVSVATEWDGSGSPSEQWFLQSPFGAEYWQATAQFRTAQYVARPTIVVNGLYPAIFSPGRW